MAFLRGINVGGHNRIKMADLVPRMTALGLKDVSSYKQSGNINFETVMADEGAIGRMIEDDLAFVSMEVVVFLRTRSQIEAMVRSEPFKDRASEDPMRYVTFLPGEVRTMRTPTWTMKRDVEVFLFQGREAFSLAYRRGERFGQPNEFLERLLKVKATTRSWNSIEGILGSL